MPRSNAEFAELEHQLDLAKDQTAASLRLLRQIEWQSFRRGPGSGPMNSGGDGVAVAACPVCGQIDPNDPNADVFIEDYVGHTEECDLAELIRQGENL